MGSPARRESRRILCAAPAYLAARGAPKRPADGGHFSSSSEAVLHGWVLEGRGLSWEAPWDVFDDLKAGRLVACLEEFRCEELELFVAFQPGNPISPRVRLFVDFIAAADFGPLYAEAT